MQDQRAAGREKWKKMEGEGRGGGGKKTEKEEEEEERRGIISWKADTS